MADRTALSRATSNSESLRTTVPRGIVKHFDLAEGDHLEWRLEIRSGKLTIEVLPVKRTSERSKAEPRPVRRRILSIKPVSRDATD
jgi:hypothetical protein